MATGKILIVDDEVINLHLLANLLIPSYSIIVSTNGQDALKKALEQSPDLILLDIMMPGMDGFEVCEHLKENNHTSHIPVIFISALNGEKDITEGYNLGAVDYIVKPYTPEMIVKRVSNFI